MIPKRMSSLNGLTICPGLHAMRAASDDTSGKAAQTGSAVGRMIELWHRGTLPGDLHLAVEAQAASEWPLADLDTARGWLTAYLADPRNWDDSEHGEVIPESLEQEVVYNLPCDESDPTGEPIRLVGHMDQVRRSPGGLKVWDVKSGRPSGTEMIAAHAWQLAAYALGATALYGEPVLPGGIIRLRGYDSKRTKPPKNVFYQTPWTLDQCRDMLGSPAYLIAMLRRGEVLSLPGASCVWCPGGGPHLCGSKIADAYP